MKLKTILLKRSILAFFFILSSYTVSYASHVAGGEISYTCIGPNQYQVTFTYYRDCNGIAATSTEVINYSSATCGVNASLSLNLVSTTDITPLCPSAASACSGGGGTIGIERIVYSGILTLPSGCSDWILSYQMCCRNGAITNVASPSSNDFYVQTTLNNTLSTCNSSPVFASNPQLFACVGQAIHYQQLASDPDGDVLVYSLVNASNASGSSLPYNGGFSGANPFTVPASINSATGEITFTPNTPQVAVVAVLVQEYRGGLLIGSMVRDIQFNIVNCTNTIPTLGGVNGAAGVYSISSCVGAPLCFTVAASDADAGQSVTMTASNNIAGSTFTQSGSGSSITGTFCWTPSSSDIGTHYITINSADNACPLIGQNSQTYAITIIANPNAPVNAGADVGICEGSTTVLTATSAAPNIISYQWSPAGSLSSTTTASTTASPLSTTAYSVLATYSDGCISTDIVNVTVNTAPVAFISPTSSTVCGGASFMLTGTTDVNGMNFQWFNPSMASLGTGTVSGTTSTLVVTVPVAPGTYVYTLQVTNPITGCIKNVTTSLIVGSPPALAACVNIYATPTGLAGNPGTQASPTSLAQALTMAACNNSVIKLATGTYNIDNPLNLSSYVTIEGGFTTGTWVKSSTPGATTINRTVLNPEGAANAQRLVAFYGNSLTGFRLQDITITTAAGTAGTGMSTYGLHLTNCSNYNIVRTQILPGAAGSGQGDNNPATYNSAWDGANGANGANGVTGGGPQCTCSFGTDNGGSGGNGGAAGAGGLNATSIGGSAGAGGAGGVGGAGRPDNTSASGFNGAAGTAAVAGGAGGAGGTGGAEDSNGNSTSNVGNGAVGTAGAAGTNGTSTAGTYIAGFWVPGSGTNGTAGKGGGGGGGGGGAARDTDGCDAAGGGGSGGGGGGGGGGAGRGAFGGGSSFGVFLISNGASGVLLQDRVVAGAAGAAGLGGTGGIGGNGGISAIGNGCTNGDTDGNRGGIGGTGGKGGNGGNGGNGPAGVSINVYLASGTALSTSDIAFNLAAQPTITASNVNCTNTNVDFTNPSSVTWNFTASATPQSPVGAAVVTQFTAINRYDIIAGANTYAGFQNISFDGSNGSQIATNAPQIGVDTYQVCQGDFASFSSVYPATTYQWNFNGAAANPGNLQNTNTQFNTPGFFTISLVVITDCCGASPAKDVLLYVVPNPTATGSGAAAICTGSSTTLTLTGLSASDVVSWSPSTAIASSTANTITVNPTVNTTYIATVTGSVTNGGTTVYGCPKTISLPVTVNSNPTMNMSSTPVICMNDGSATATMTSAGLYNYTWSNGGSTINAVSSTINALPTGNYSVTATNATTGCFVSDNVFVFPSLTQPNPYVQSNTPTCAGIASGSATVNTMGGTAAYTYLWNGTTNIVSPSSITQTNLLGGNYTVDVTDNNGCVSTLSLTIPELPLPLYSVIDNGPICMGEDAIFTVSGSDGATLTYNLGAGNTTILLDDEGQDIIIANTIIDNTMTLVSVDGNCLVPLSSSSTIIANNCALPIELVSFDAKCVGRDKDFRWTTASEIDNDFFTIEHSKDGTTFTKVVVIDATGNSNSTINYQQVVQEKEPEYVYYRLKQTDIDGNSSYSDIIYSNCQLINGGDVVVYPNPTNNLLNVHFDEDLQGEFTLILTDLLGKTVSTRSVMKEKGADISISVGKIAVGNYLLRIESVSQNVQLPVVHVSIAD